VELKIWEIDVDLRMRRTLLIRGPLNEEKAREVAVRLLIGGVELSSFLKWSDGRSAFRPMQVETRIDNDPTIVAVREMPA
jgi:hypothetical protein